MAAGTKADAKPNEMRGTLPAGTRLRNYELLSVLGHGGFGITYYAKDTTLGREVAVKEYLPTTLALRENGSTVVPRSTQFAEDFIWGRERFLEEARILATLEGAPAVVRVYDFLEANGTAYMIMGLARGDTLEQRLKRDGKMSPAIIQRMLDRLLDGLDAVHKTGFLHRDVKPANVILDANNNPTLIDFGASRSSMADRTAAMTAIFTPRYAAAEQLTSDKQGPWTDIYGLSATLYHAITGKAPPSSLERALNDAYEPLAKLSPEGYAPGLLQGHRCRPDGAGQGPPAVDRGMARHSFIDRRAAGRRRDRIRAAEASPEAQARAFARVAAHAAAGEQAAASGGDSGRFCGSVARRRARVGICSGVRVVQSGVRRDESRRALWRSGGCNPCRRGGRIPDLPAAACASSGAVQDAVSDAAKAEARPSERPKRRPNRGRRPKLKPSKRPKPTPGNELRLRPSRRLRPRPSRRRTPRPGRKPTPTPGRGQRPRPSERPTRKPGRRRTPKPSREPTPTPGRGRSGARQKAEAEAKQKGGRRQAEG
jgi:serine/threonine protein kinase